VISLGFVGDIAVPNPIEWDNPECLRLPSVDLMFANLEGPVRSESWLRDATYAEHKPIRLFSSEMELQQALRAFNIGCVSLANNHIFDLGTDLTATLGLLEQSHIAYCGAGQRISEARRPAYIQLGDYEIIALAFGWEPIGAPPAGQDGPGVNPLTWKNATHCVERARADHPHALVVCMMHWNYELERFPQPAHREIAFALIDRGADIIVGHHSHTVQGIESYAGKPILYGLGNWFLPQVEYIGRRLTYPTQVNRELAVQVRFDPARNVGGMDLHWFDFDAGTSQLIYSSSESCVESSIIKALTPFAGLAQDEYLHWFRRNRVKRRFLPVYRYAEARMENWLKDRFLVVRQRGVETLIRVGWKA
jgi:hypothetical protein